VAPQSCVDDVGRYCDGFTDIGVSALAVRCGQQQLINLMNCKRITDIGIYQNWRMDAVSCNLLIS
jgi:hypothetical protein